MNNIRSVTGDLLKNEIAGLHEEGKKRMLEFFERVTTKGEDMHTCRITTKKVILSERESNILNEQKDATKKAKESKKNVEEQKVLLRHRMNEEDCDDDDDDENDDGHQEEEQQREGEEQAEDEES